MKNRGESEEPERSSRPDTGHREGSCPLVLVLSG